MNMIVSENLAGTSQVLVVERPWLILAAVILSWPAVGGIALQRSSGRWYGTRQVHTFLQLEFPTAGHVLCQTAQDV